MKTPLTPPDTKRCQAEWTRYNAFVMGGPTRTRERCPEKPLFVAREKEVGPDGRRGSMSVCAACRKVLQKAVASKELPPVAFEKLKPRTR